MMGIKSLLRKELIAAFISLLAIFFYNKYNSNFSKGSTPVLGNVFSQNYIAQFTGERNEKLLLSIMGNIFDVTKGKQYYGKEAPYCYFVGKDGTRAFVTGDFLDESNNKDHVLDLTCDQILSLKHWEQTFQTKYKYIGKLIGRYFNEEGQPTEYSNQLKLKLQHCKTEKEIAKQEELKYPPCNIEWSPQQGHRVWCTKSSGGISRQWDGVPRQLYSPGEKNPRCACVNLEEEYSSALLKEYEKCLPTSTSCHVTQ